MARYDDAWGRVGRWGYDRPFQQPQTGRNEGYGGGGPGRWRADRDFGESGAGSAFNEGLYGPGRYGLGPYHERLKKRRRAVAELKEEVEEAPAS